MKSVNSSNIIINFVIAREYHCRLVQIIHITPSQLRRCDFDASPLINAQYTTHLDFRRPLSIVGRPGVERVRLRTHDSRSTLLSTHIAKIQIHSFVALEVSRVAFCGLHSYIKTTNR
jgi:hypothetical protein